MTNKKQRGLTLLETIIAIAVLTALITPIFASYAYSIRAEQRALLHTLATYTAQMKMEEAYGISAAALTDRFNTPGRQYFTDGDEEGPEGFYYTYSALRMPGSTVDERGREIVFADLNLYLVTITIGRDDYDIDVTITDIFSAH